MKKLLPFLCAVVGLIAGGAVAYVVASEDAPPQTPQAAVVEPDATGNTREPEGSQPTSSATVTQKPGEPKSAPADDGVITGRVSLLDGGKLRGVRIIATPLLQSGEPAPDASVHDQVEAFASHRARERELRGTAETEGNGAYRVAGLQPDLLYALTPILEGYRFRADRGNRVTHYKVGGEVDFTAEPIVRVSAKVRLPDGSTADFAQIVYESQGSGQRRYWYWNPLNASDDAPPGEYLLSVEAGEFRQYRASGVTLSLRHGEPAAPLEIDLAASPGIIGRVNPPAGMDTQLRIHIDRVDGATPPDAGHPRSREAMLRERGEHLSGHNLFRFAFLELAPGKYRLRVRQGNTDVKAQEVTVTNALVEVELDLPEPEPADFIIMRVVGPDGPITGDVEIYLHFNDGNRGFSGGTAVINRGNGEYWIAREAHRFSTDGGSYEINVSSRKYGRTKRAYGRADTHIVEVTFNVPTYINVEITGWDAHEQKEQLTVTVVAASEQANRGNRLHPARQDTPTGTMRFGPLEPGDYVVALLVRNQSRSDEFPLDRREFRAAPGENTVRVTPQTLYSFTVIVPEEYRKEQLNLELLTDRTWHMAQRKSGEPEVEFTNLIAGEYKLQCLPSGVMKVSLPQAAGQRILFQPLPFNAYLVTGGGGVDIGLKDGDHVVEIDGTVISGMRQRQQLVADAIKKESTTWVVIRDGARVSVTFDGREWRNAGFRGESARME
jgi:hypothetical protein